VGEKYTVNTTLNQQHQRHEKRKKQPITAPLVN